MAKVVEISKVIRFGAVDLTANLPKKLRFLGLDVFQRADFSIRISCDEYAVKIVAKVKNLSLK